MKWNFGLLWMGLVCAAQGQTVQIPLVISMSCDATYSETATAAGLNGRCSGLAQPFGMASMTLAMTGRLSDAGAVSGIGGRLVFSFSGGMGFEAGVDGATARASGASGMVILVSAGIRQGSGAMANAVGNLALALDGVSEKEGTARISVSGSGTVSAPALKPGPAVPAGPGTLGEVLETGGAACGDPVAVTNGNMYHRFADLTVAGRTFPIAVVRTYNSQAAAVDSPFGYGWTHSYREGLRASGSGMVFESGSGSAIVFAAAGSGYSAAAAPGLKLEREGTGYRLRSDDGTARRFDAAGKLTSMADGNGNGQSYGYDSAGRLLTIRDGAGGVATFSYDGAGHITAIEDQTGRRASYEYDSAGNLAAATAVGQTRTTFEYADHVMQKMTRAGEAPITFRYQMDGKAAGNARQDGTVLEFGYGTGQTTVKEGEAAVGYEFNAAGQITRTVGADGGVRRQAWTGAGRLESAVDELGQKRSYTYDEAGRVLSKTDALGNTVRFGYDGVSGRLLWFADAAGNRTEYGYDAQGNRVSVKNALGEETRLKYDSRGLLGAETKADGSTVEAAFDEAGNAVEQRDAAGLLWKARYDSLRRVTGLTGPEGVEKKFEWDAGGRLVKLTDPAVGVTARSYDGAGRLTKESGPGQPAAEYGYDQAGRLKTVKDALGNVFQYEYGANGKLAAMVDPLGGRKSYEYDAAGRITREKLADGKERRWGWNARGDLISKTVGDGREARMEYDAARRLVKTTGADGEEETFVYDERGNTLQASNTNVTLYYAYDALNRVVSVTDSRGPYTIGYSYDGAGRRKTMTEPGGGVTTYEYDGAGRLTGVVNGAGRAYRFEYGANRKRSRAVYAGGMTAEYDYDEAGRPSRIAYGTTVVYTAEYDAAGNRKTLSGPEGTHRFEFDALNRVTAAMHPTLAAESFSYDAAGRRENAPVSSLKVEMDGLGRVRSAETADGRRVSFRYDPYGRLIERETGGAVTMIVHDGGQALVEMDGQGAAAVRRTYAGQEGEVLEEERGGGVYQYLIDLRGNVGAVAKLGGGGMGAARRKGRGADEPAPEPALVETEEYTVYGEVSETGPEAGMEFLTFLQQLAEPVSGLVPVAGQTYEPAATAFAPWQAVTMGTMMVGAGVGAQQGSHEVLAQMMASPMGQMAMGILGGANPLGGGSPLSGVFTMTATPGEMKTKIEGVIQGLVTHFGGRINPALLQAVVRPASQGGTAPEVAQSGSGWPKPEGGILGQLGAQMATIMHHMNPAVGACAGASPGLIAQMLYLRPQGQMESAQTQLTGPWTAETLAAQETMHKTDQMMTMLTQLMEKIHVTDMGIISGIGR